MKHIEKGRVLKGVLAFSTAALMAVGFAPATMFMSDVYVSAEESAAIKLEAGKYSITANPYVTAEQAPIGSNVYLGTNFFPPLAPAGQVSTMTVEENGDIYVKFPVEQEIFTLQDVTDGKDIHVVSIERGGKNAPYGPYSDRITSVTVKLDNTNGEYVFGTAKEYPTLLETDETWDIHLNVDFSTAILIPDAGYENTFTDEKTGIAFDVRAEKESNSVAALMSANLTVDEITEGKEYNSAKASLKYKYETLPDSFALYDIELKNGEDDVAVDEYVTMQASIPVTSDKATVYTTSCGRAVKVEGEVKNGKFVFTPESFGKYIVVDNESGVQYNFSNSYTGSVKGSSVMVGVSSLDTADPLWDWSFWDMFQSYVADVININDIKYTEVVQDGRTYKVIDNETTNAYWNKLDVSGSGKKLADETGDFEKAEVDGIYAAAASFDQTYQTGENGPEFFNPNSRTSWEAHSYGTVNIPDSSRDKYLNFREKVTVPVSSDNCSVYKISGTPSTGITNIEKMDADIANGYATVTLFDYDDITADCPNAGFWNALSGFDQVRTDSSGKKYYNSNAGSSSSSSKTYWSDNTEISYIMVVKEEDKPIAKPTAAEGLKYTGKEQVGVAEGEGYTLSGTPSATESGTYTVTATLKDGYVWEDGTYDAINLVYNIAKVENVDVGVYTVTANLYCPGELNTQLPGVTAYLTNGNNPLGIGGYDKVAPTEPVYKNAELTVEADGTKYITVDILNPVFTLQEIGDCSNAEIVEIVRDNETYVSGVDSSVTREGRITKLKVKLLDDSGKYVFNKCTEFPTLLGVDWNVPLTLEVDFNGDKRPDDSSSQPDESSDTDKSSSEITDDSTTSSTGSSADSKTASASDSSSKAANSASTKNPGTGARGLALAGAAICGALCMITGRKSRKDK